MKTIRSPSIRSRLTVLVVSCIIPVLLMATMLIYYDYHRARAQLVQNSVMTARAMASVVDNEFSIDEATLLTLATSPHLAANDFAGFHAQANEVLRGERVINIVLSDKNGRQYINTLRPFGESLPLINSAPPLRIVNDTGKAAISNLFIGPVSKRAVVAIGVPVHHGNMVLSSSISPERFGKLLSQQNFPLEWIAVVLDKNGTIVARTHAMQRFIGQKAVPELLNRLAISDEGTFTGISKDNIPIFGVFSRAANSNWTVAIGIPEENLVSELRHIFFWLFFAITLLLGCSLFLARILGGKIGQSVRGLVVPALALGAGEVVKIQSFNLREADEVGAALVRASDMLIHAQYQATHDTLTGLANRALFKEVLAQRITLCQRNNTCLSILYIDLDGFKQINDGHGHAIGDKLLQANADRLEAEIRKSDVAARLGGDEFAVMLFDTSTSEAADVAMKIVDSLSTPYSIENLFINISASIGISGFPDSGSTNKELLRRADNAMYKAKALGKGCVVVAED